MGNFWSKRQQNHHHPHHHHHPPPPPPPSSIAPPFPSLYPPPPPPHPTYSLPPTSTTPLPSQNPYPFLPPPPRPPPHNYPPPSTSYYHFSFSQSSYGTRPVVYQNHYPPHSNNGWVGFRPPPPPPPPPPVPYVDHQKAKKIQNDVNVHKDTIKVQIDEFNKDFHLVSFTFDALVDGSITIFYFAKEGDNCKFSPVYPEIKPVQIPFRKGLGQKFCQPSGTGVDLGFFDVNDLSNPLQGEEIFPLVISAESCNEKYDGQSPDKSPHSQITEAVLVKNNNEDHFQVKVIKQILWIEGVRYELREIYGINNSDETNVNDEESGKECVICMTEPKDTAVLPCRHMCLCGECAKELRHQSNKCPICRQPIEELLEIKVNEGKPR